MRDCTEEENEYLKRYAEQERNVTGPRRSVHLWEFLLELLMDDSSSAMIQWTDEMNGEFKLKNSEDVARKWGQRKHKEGMNYDKLSRALRYYYSKEIIKKVSGRRFVYKFVPSPEIYAAVNAIKAHMIRNGAQQIPLGPFPHYRQAENIPASQDTKPFMFYPHLRARSISPRTESDLASYPHRPSPPRSRSPNCYRTDELYKSDSHILLSHSYKNEELVRKMKYFKQEETRYSSSSGHFQRRHHSETNYRHDEHRTPQHQRLTPPLVDSPRRDHSVHNKYYSPTYDYENSNTSQERKSGSICLNNTTVEKVPEQLNEFFRRQSNGSVPRENGSRHEDRKPVPSAFISLESRNMHNALYPPSQVKSEPQPTGYCKDCPSCNLQPPVSECDDRKARWYESTPTNGVNDNNLPRDDNYYRRHIDSTSSDDVFYPRKYAPMVDASTQTDNHSERATPPKTDYYNVRAWMDLNTTHDLRISRNNGHVEKPLSPPQYNNNNSNNTPNNNGNNNDSNNNNNNNNNHTNDDNSNNSNNINNINGKRKSYSPDEFSGSDNVSRISTPSSITNPPTPVPTSTSASLICKCGCMDSAGSPALPTTNGTVVVYPKEVL